MRNLLIIFNILMLLPLCANAEGIVVRKAEIRLTDEGYQLTANYDIRLTLLLEQALSHGVTLNFTSEFSLTRPRWYWFDKVAANSEQGIKLSYSPLTQQYRLKRGNIFQNFASLEIALRVLGNQASEFIPAEVMPAELFNKNTGYFSSLLSSTPKFTAYARMRLDVSQLPKPLQVNALTSDEWRLDSEGYSWVISADEITLAPREAP